MKHGIWYVVLMIGIAAVPCYSFIYQAHILRRWDDSLHRYSYFIGLSDFHDRTHAVTASQRAFLEQILAHMAPEKAKIIVEDLSSPGVGGRMSCGGFCLGAKGGILSGLGDYCTQQALDVENVEYRYCRVISMGPVLDRVRHNRLVCDGLQATVQTRLGMVHHEVIDMMHEIAAYDDGPIAHAYYLGIIADITAHCKELRLQGAPHQSVAEYLHMRLERHNPEAALKHILTFDSGLIDAKMVHAVIQADHKEKIIAIAGGTHIEAVADLLETIGYERVPIGIGIHAPAHTIDQCVGVSSPRAGERPEPIDLTMLIDYL